MGYRQLFLSSPSALSVKDRQLVVALEGRQVRFPLEDLDAVMVEQPRTTMTAPVLTALAKQDVALFLCDEKHIPCCQLLPYLQHSRQLAVLRTQLGITEPRNMFAFATNWTMWQSTGRG